MLPSEVSLSVGRLLSLETTVDVCKNRRVLCCEDYHVCADHDRFNFEKRRETITVFDICRLAILLADSIYYCQQWILRLVFAKVQKSDLKIVFRAKYFTDFGSFTRLGVRGDAIPERAACKLREVRFDLSVQDSSSIAKSTDWCYTSG